MSEIDQKFLDGQVQGLTAYLERRRDEALERFSGIVGKAQSVHQFHAHIGRNNNTFVDSVRTQFGSPEEFIALWLRGLIEQVNLYAKKRAAFGSTYLGTEWILPKVLQDNFLKDYTYRFLERNFYRNFQARVRAKPDEILWQLWFGQGELCWGLIISPALRLGAWTNDKSQMRREAYEYWTIGHVMETGLIDPNHVEPLRFDSVKNFLTFYATVLARVSKSPYEKGISERYLAYVRGSAAPLGEPLLIPELRYAGKERKHRYRLDFTVLNPYAMSMAGFEISPASTHMAIEGIRNKTQVQFNKELSVQWAKEMDKRNAYFLEFGITTITFTDEQLGDIDDCFAWIRKALAERPMSRANLGNSEADLQAACARVGL